jgi:hypothetical protein
MEQTNDAEYCADVIDVVTQVASTRVFSHMHKNTRFFLLLPDVIYISKPIDEETTVLLAVKASYAARVLLDGEQKKGIAVLLEAPSHVVTLIYEREGGKNILLKKTMVTNRQLLGAVS